MKQTPRANGYYMPAEWVRHDATWLSWPKNSLTFPGDILTGVEQTYCLMVKSLSQVEKVKIIVNDEETEERVRHMLERAGANMHNVIFPHIKSSDVWIRDYGPTFLLHQDTGMKAVVKWDFNAWGAKYDDILYDNIAGEDVAQSTGLPIFRPEIVMEGGAIDVNGAGIVLTTEQCLLNENRNPHLSRADIEEYLREYLNIDEIVWLKSGIEGDDTDGHVDDFARFISEDTVICAHSSAGGGHNPKVLQTNLEILENYRNSDGCPLNIITLPMPDPVPIPEEGGVLPASYANFYIGNGVVLLPIFNDSNDSIAIEIMEEAMPEHHIIPIYARDLVYGYGSFHCVTQQEPAEKR
ncbi:MAG: agmatine deiminase family protein [Euryarchaeota archaeon]|nr:agmatine deiminase family protein [Euryarchaeota archaeon]